MSSEAVLSAGMLALTWIRFHPEKWTNANMMSPDCFRLLHRSVQRLQYLYVFTGEYELLLFHAYSCISGSVGSCLCVLMTVIPWRLQMHPLGLRMQNDSLLPFASAQSGYVSVPTLWLNRELQGFLSKYNSLWTNCTVGEFEVWLDQKTRSGFVRVSNMSSKLSLHWDVGGKVFTV